MAADDTPPADEPKAVKVQIPTTMRPRATPNAEINAQLRDKAVRDAGVGYPLAPNQAFARGGGVPPPAMAPTAAPPSAAGRPPIHGGPGMAPPSVKPPGARHPTALLGYNEGGKVIPTKAKDKFDAC